MSSPNPNPVDGARPASSAGASAVRSGVLTVIATPLVLPDRRRMPS